MLLKWKLFGFPLFFVQFRQTDGGQEICGAGLEKEKKLVLD
jgi:hypothetical protein